jgi:hypothetical protein
MTKPTSQEILIQCVLNETEGKLWGQKHPISPRLISEVFGDGQKLIGIMPLNSRPNYYIARVDSDLDLDFDDDDDEAVFDLIEEEILDAAEEDFCSVDSPQYIEKDGQEIELTEWEDKETDWPMCSFNNGYKWFPIDAECYSEQAKQIALQILEAQH